MLQVNINMTDLERVITRMPAAVKESTYDALDHASAKFIKTFKAQRLQGDPGIKSHGSHGIIKQFQRFFFLNTSSKGSGVSIFSESKIAKMHEEGATIRDPQGGGVPVPLKARQELFTGSGALKKRYRGVKRTRTIVPIKFGSQYYLSKVNRKNREQPPLPLFVLKKEVILKKRLGFYELWNSMQATVFQILSKRFMQGVGRAWENG